MRHQARIVSSIAFAAFLAASAFASSSRAANPAGNGGDAAATPDAGDDAGSEADSATGEVPEGIQPTTTPDNFGCSMHELRATSNGGEAPFGALGALGIMTVAWSVARRRRAQERQS